MNGRPVSELDLQQIDEILQQVGKAIPITVRRNVRMLKIILKLKERI